MRLLRILAMVLLGCASQDSNIPPNHDYGGLRKPPEFEPHKQDEPVVPPAAQPEDPCPSLCKSLNEASTRCEAAIDPCEAKTNYLRSVCRRECTSKAALEAGACGGDGSCLDVVAASENSCRTSCNSSFADNPECRKKRSACGQRDAAEKEAETCSC
jgi:hypothetical protein